MTFHIKPTTSFLKQMTLSPFHAAILPVWCIRLGLPCGALAVMAVSSRKLWLMLASSVELSLSAFGPGQGYQMLVDNGWLICIYDGCVPPKSSFCGCWVLYLTLFTCEFVNDSWAFWHWGALDFRGFQTFNLFFFIWLMFPKREVVEIGGQLRRIGHDPTGVREENKDDLMGLVLPHMLCIEEPPIIFPRMQIRKQVLQVERWGSTWFTRSTCS